MASIASNAASPPASPTTGYVFIIHSDITMVACDCWVSATSGVLDSYRRPIGYPMLNEPLSFYSQRSRTPDVSPQQESWVYEMDQWPLPGITTENVPRPYFINLNTTIGRGADDSDLKGERLALQIQIFIDRAVQNFGNEKPLFGRSKHLIALPLLASGMGGMHKNTGVVVGAILPVLFRKTSELNVDVVLVLYDKIEYEAAQKERARLFPHGYRQHLRPTLSDMVEKLATLACQGNLALFFGAGASMGADLPSWANLLKKLGTEFSINPVEFKKLSFLDQAKIIEKKLAKKGRSVGEEIAKLFSSSSYISILHAIFSSLPASAFITTNYDVKFETAHKACRSERMSILPYRREPSAHKFLLKLHGCVNHPQDIVLTREDYIRYNQDRAVLGGVLQSTLLTKHVLYVGFSLTDDNFHAIFDAVKKSVHSATPKNSADTTKLNISRNMSGGLQENNTALLLKASELQKQLWEDDVGIIALQDNANRNDDGLSYPDLARRQEILLDALVHEATIKQGNKFLLSERFAPLLSESEQRLKEILLNARQEILNIPGYDLLSASRAVEDMYVNLGCRAVNII